MANAGIHEEDFLTEPEADEESEGESLFNERPVNSYYFERLNRPQETVEEALTTSAEAESKAREAGSQGSSSAIPPSQVSSAPSSPRSTWTMPVVEDAPPPTYESISRDSPAPIMQPPISGYGSISDLGISLRAEPQRMSDELTQRTDEESGLLRTIQQKHDSRRRRFRHCKPVSLCNAALVVAIVILVAIATKYTSGISSPPKAPALPHIPDMPSHSSCDLTVASHTLAFDFPSVRNFTFLETMESSNYVSGGIDGKVHILPATPSQKSDIRLRIFYAISDSWRVVSSDYTTTDDSLELQLPKLESVDEHAAYTKPCLYVWVGIEVRSSVIVENWEIATGNLDIQIDDGLFNQLGQDASPHIQVTGSSVFSAVHGNVLAGQYWSSRRTEVETISGSIRGFFAMRDFLSFKTQSGSIIVRVDPKAEDPEHPSPAEFQTHSSSGSVTVHFPTVGDIPIRDYRTRIQTASGSLHGNYIMGTLFSYRTQSGAVNADLLPIIESTETSVLLTDTKSASQTWKILSPYAYPGRFADSRLDHKFTSASGSLNLKYPDEWEGWIEGDTMSGSIDVHGKDVDIVHLLDNQTYWPIYRHIIARKGEGRGKLKFRTSSGSVAIQAGEL